MIKAARPAYTPNMSENFIFVSHLEQVLSVCLHIHALPYLLWHHNVIWLLTLSKVSYS